MTQERAKKLLGMIWGSGGDISASQQEEIDAVSSPNEVAIDTLQRIAGDSYDWRREKNWDKRRQHFAQYQ